jgi:hypothetical protein
MTKTSTLTLTASIRVPEDVLFHDLSGEAVILNLGSGKYYGLDEVGTRMWTLLSEHGRIEPAYRALIDEYEVDAGRLQSDLLALVGELAGQGLLLVYEETHALDPAA